MYIDDTISTVKSLVGFTDMTDICRPVVYTEFNTLIIEIKNLSMEVNFMDSSDGLGRSKNNIGADIQVSRSEERRVGKECRSRWSPYH